MGHEAPERAPDVAAGRRPDVADARQLSAPATELTTLDALADRAAAVPVASPSGAAALRPTSLQRLQLRAGNAAVASMLKRRAAPPAAARKPAAALQRKPSAVTPTAPAGPV